MAKSRATKQAWVEQTNTDMKSAEILIIAHYKGLTVAQMTQLRSDVRKAGAGFRVTKNKLTTLALKGTQYEKLSDMFKGPTAVAYATDPVSAAKALSEFAKKNDKLQLVGGAFGEMILDQASIQKLASLPSLNELRAKIVGLLQAPATKVAGVLQAPAGQLARVFNAYATKA